MMKYFHSRINKIFSVVAITLGASLPFFSCTKTDSLLGSDLIPESDRMAIRFDTTYDIKAYPVTIDSVSSSSWGVAYLGSAITSQFGRTSSGIVCQMTPTSFLSADSLWGDEPTIDSAILYLGFNGYIGDTTRKMTARMYALNRAIPYPYDSLCYSNFKVKDYINPTPIVSFTHQGALDMLSVKLPNKFAEQLLDTTGMRYSGNDSIFHHYYPGYYFECDDLSSHGALYRMTPSETYVYVYYHNKNKPNADTTYARFSFDNTSGVTLNRAFSVLKHDYSYADPIVGVKTSYFNKKDESTPQTYVQSLGGLLTRVTIPEAYLDGLVEKAKREGYSNIAINKATLTVLMQNPSPEFRNSAPPRLGTYRDYQNDYVISDYDPGASSSSSGGTASSGAIINEIYDGWLNPVFGGYSMNISSHVQRLVSKKIKYYDIDLASTWSDEANYYGVVLNNGGQRRIMLTVTYTMLK